MEGHSPGSDTSHEPAEPYNEHGTGHGEHDTSMYPGLAVAAGSYLWFTPKLGAVVEGAYNLIDEEGLTSELGGNLGMAYAW